MFVFCALEWWLRRQSQCPVSVCGPQYQYGVSGPPLDCLSGNCRYQACFCVAHLNSNFTIPPVLCIRQTMVLWYCVWISRENRAGLVSCNSLTTDSTRVLLKWLPAITQVKFWGLRIVLPFLCPPVILTPKSASVGTEPTRMNWQLPLFSLFQGLSSICAPETRAVPLLLPHREIDVCHQPWWVP